MWDIPRPRYKIIQSELQNNRLGAVFEICHLYLEQKFYSNAKDDLFSLIIFNQNSEVIVFRKSIKEFQYLLRDCSSIAPDGLTNFDLPLELALKEQKEFIEEFGLTYKFKFIFLTDGDGEYKNKDIWKLFIDPYCFQNMNYITPKNMTLLPEFHFIIFGDSKEGKEKLGDMKSHILEVEKRKTNNQNQVSETSLMTIPIVEVYQSNDYMSLEKIFMDKILSSQ